MSKTPSNPNQNKVARLGVPIHSFCPFADLEENRAKENTAEQKEDSANEPIPTQGKTSVNSVPTKEVLPILGTLPPTRRLSIGNSPHHENPLNNNNASINGINHTQENNVSYNIRANQYACCIDPKTIRVEEFNFCKKKIQELKLSMRLIQTSYLEEDRRLVFFFTAPERVDFRDLLRILRQQYFGIRIELRQIGQRDAASLLGGIGICGRELCCCSFLRSFSPITAKIAKKVGPTPNPAMYCGLCGRLRCCLRYEETEQDLESDDTNGDGVWEQYEDH